MFVDHAEAIVGFPGGFGTMDEVFESLVLIQTGKSPIVPVVWSKAKTVTSGSGRFHQGCLAQRRLDQPGRPRPVPNCVFARRRLWKKSLVLPGVPVRPLRARQVGTAVDPEALTEGELAILNEEFSILIASGRIENTAALRRRRSHPPAPVGLPPPSTNLVWFVNSSIASTVLMLRDSDCCPSGFGSAGCVRASVVSIAEVAAPSESNSVEVKRRTPGIDSGKFPFAKP